MRIRRRAPLRARWTAFVGVDESEQVCSLPDTHQIMSSRGMWTLRGRMRIPPHAAWVSGGARAGGAASSAGVASSKGVSAPDACLGAACCTEAACLAGPASPAAVARQGSRPDASRQAQPRAVALQESSPCDTAGATTTKVSVRTGRWWRRRERRSVTISSLAPSLSISPPLPAAGSAGGGRATQRRVRVGTSWPCQGLRSSGFCGWSLEEHL